MSTEVAVDGPQFLINGRPTYEGVDWRGHKVQGLLMNSRMIQAIFDDESPETRPLWRYPDTGEWDPDRNTDEFCAALPGYRAHGLLAVTVGLQGGSPRRDPDVYDTYVNSAFRPDGSFKEAYFDRLSRVLAAADEAGMVVIVNYLYWKQVERIPEEQTILEIVERTTDRLLRTGHRNILVDVANESHDKFRHPVCRPDGIHRLIEIVQNTTRDGRRLPAGASTLGGDHLSVGRWREVQDIFLPHGNGCTPDQLRDKLRRLKESDAFRDRPRPIVINEDDVILDNLDTAVEEYAAWGYFDPGHGHGYHALSEAGLGEREDECDDLSGYQAPPVNWGINTPTKRAFFERVKEITGGQ
jgi:hypothetical protein